jgi:hypothetical protein
MVISTATMNTDSMHAVVTSARRGAAVSPAGTGFMGAFIRCGLAIQAPCIGQSRRREYLPVGPWNSQPWRPFICCTETKEVAMDDSSRRFSEHSETDDPVAKHSNSITYTAAAVFAALIVALVVFAPGNNGTSNQVAVNTPSDSGPALSNPHKPPARTPVQ